jgi:hypothetical protein
MVTQEHQINAENSGMCKPSTAEDRIPGMSRT